MVQTQTVNIRKRPLPFLLFWVCIIGTFDLHRAWPNKSVKSEPTHLGASTPGQNRQLHSMTCFDQQSSASKSHPRAVSVTLNTLLLPPLTTTSSHSKPLTLQAAALHTTGAAARPLQLRPPPALRATHARTGRDRHPQRRKGPDRLREGYEVLTCGKIKQGVAMGGMNLECVTLRHDEAHFIYELIVLGPSRNKMGCTKPALSGPQIDSS